MLCLPIHGEPRNVRHGPLAHISRTLRVMSAITPNSGHSSAQVCMSASCHQATLACSH